MAVDYSSGVGTIYCKHSNSCMEDEFLNSTRVLVSLATGYQVKIHVNDDVKPCPSDIMQGTIYTT